MAYVPIAADSIGFGVVRRNLSGKRNSVPDFIRGKLHPIGKPADPACDWAPTAECWEVLLPIDAQDDLIAPRRLCAAFEEASWIGMKDLVVMTTVKFPGIQRLHTGWEQARGFARQRLAMDRRLPVIMVMHVPARTGSRNDVYVHLMALARELTSIGFGGFPHALTCDEGADVMAREWRDWCAAHPL